MKKLFGSCCCLPSKQPSSSSNSDSFGRQDGLLWCKDFGLHVNGEFSMAVVQANSLLEDRCQIESGSLSLLDSGPVGTFVGVYDGHGGPQAAQYVNTHLFNHIKRFTTEKQSMCVDVIKKAIQATEDGFLCLVSEQWPSEPQLAAVGTCCLVGIVCGEKIYVSNLGDTRAVLGRLVKSTGEILAMQLSDEHNASITSIRHEMQLLHPHDSQIVMLRQNVWRIKGLIQVSRTIGDIYLKKPEFNREPLPAKFLLKETFKQPILRAEPSISVVTIHPDDQFIIFASDGLWEQLSNQDAVNMVQNGPRKGIACKLVKAALTKAAKQREMRYSDLMKIDKGVRRHFHDDITVIVLFLNHNLLNGAKLSKGSMVSLKGSITVPTSTLAPFPVAMELNGSS
ncbi:hypothetical protein HPP92_020633 [Vanilla planifolia]|uniref:protein-serine/threonine phosphatase n=1 Tax=Vanilla planifolia TaxID=51239 RepID=A0A835UHS6_VANPL|nr:hypothetical protein HPP92_021065 [Vanilla planifolia]KAG0462157.1 hypothetical protein HPP92_020633 [Vanilla planifolia]